MKDKIYKRILIAVLAVGLIFTVAHVAYAIYAYNNSSIIYFITKEWW